MFHHFLLGQGKKKNTQSPRFPFRLVSPPMFLFGFFAAIYLILCPFRHASYNTGATYFIASSVPGSVSILAFLPGDIFFCLSSII